MCMCHIDLLSQIQLNLILYITPKIGLGKVFMMLLKQKRIGIFSKLISLYKVIVSNVDSTRITIQVIKNCMTELLLQDNTQVLSLFDTGSNVDLISESVLKSSEYLSSLPIRNCPEYRIRNTSGEMVANKFIEFCFRVKDNYILHTTALLVPDFGSVKFLLSISSMNQLNSVVDVSHLA